MSSELSASFVTPGAGGRVGPDTGLGYSGRVVCCPRLLQEGVGHESPRAFPDLQERCRSTSVEVQVVKARHPSNEGSPVVPFREVCPRLRQRLRHSGPGDTAVRKRRVERCPDDCGIAVVACRPRACGVAVAEREVGRAAEDRDTESPGGNRVCIEIGQERQARRRRRDRSRQLLKLRSHRPRRIAEGRQVLHDVRIARSHREGAEILDPDSHEIGRRRRERDRRSTEPGKVRPRRLVDASDFRVDVRLSAGACRKRENGLHTIPDERVDHSRRESDVRSRQRGHVAGLADLVSLDVEMREGIRITRDKEQLAGNACGVADFAPGVQRDRVRERDRPGRVLIGGEVDAPHLREDAPPNVGLPLVVEEL